jgi:hypothetical protein
MRRASISLAEPPAQRMQPGLFARKVKVIPKHANQLGSTKGLGLVSLHRTQVMELIRENDHWYINDCSSFWHR